MWEAVRLLLALVTASSNLPLLCFHFYDPLLSYCFRSGPFPLGVTLHISTLTFSVLLIISEANLTYLFSKFLVGV